MESDMDGLAAAAAKDPAEMPAEKAAQDDEEVQAIDFYISYRYPSKPNFSLHSPHSPCIR